VRVKFATFSKNGERQKVVKNSKKLGEIEINLKNIFKSIILVEKYEKSQIDLNIEILQTDGGGEICALVNASTLALIDAGICMKEYICACTASLTNDGVALLDVSHLEEICGQYDITISHVHTLRYVSFIHHRWTHFDNCRTAENRRPRAKRSLC
jgi:exosome complex component RRP41